VEVALAELPERQRAALWLAAVEGLSYAEVAEALDVSEKAVKALVHRARSGLAQRLAAAREPRGEGE
jgi:RNA polymerase sigma-70 factor (ECF subfamily)